MKTILPLLALMFAPFVLRVGCGPRSGPDSDAQLTADELARLQDFHVWKIPLLQSQQPLKGVQLVMVKADGTAVRTFSTGSSELTPSWTNILLGIRYEGGGCVGKMETPGAKGTLSWRVSFTNAADQPVRSWVVGKIVWQGNRAELATFWNSAEAARSSGGTDYSTLAVELVK